MTRIVDRDLEALRERVLRMGGLTEAILAKSLRALSEHSPALCAEVQKDDLEIDRLDVEIDEDVIRVLALQAPVARDLRHVIGIKAMATDLERVGDLARNIAKSAARIIQRPDFETPAKLEKLADDCRRILRRALDCFAQRDPHAARAVLAADDQIDAEEAEVIRDALAEIASHPESSPVAVDLIMIANNLERVADHATNIAEDVVLVAEARNLKHAEKLGA